MKNKVTLYLEDEVNFFEEQETLLDKIKAVINQCLEEEKVPYEVEISLSIVDLETIQEINREHRQIDRVTDVLSFPQIDPETIGYINWDKLDLTSCINYDTEEVMLGDIIICVDKAKEQAESYGHSLEREVCFLVAHSMFHLLGYDHMTEDDEKNMAKKQEDVLQCLSILR